MNDLNLHPTEEQFDRLTFLNNIINTRNGIVLVGPTYSGKTTCLHSLQAVNN